jgi:hypothetical protein
MHFKTDGRDVWNWRFQIVDLKFEDADLREATKIATNSLASSSKGSTNSLRERADKRHDNLQLPTCRSERAG